MKGIKFIFLIVFQVFALILPNQSTSIVNELNKVNSYEIAFTLPISDSFEFNGTNREAYDAKFKDEFDKNKTNEINISISSIESITIGSDNYFEGIGFISLSDNIITFKVSGYLYPYEDIYKKTVYVGVLEGYINDENSDQNSISLGIHCLPDQNKTFVTACIGVDNGSGSKPVILDFGKPFTEQKYAVEDKMKHDKITDSSNSIPALQGNQDFQATPMTFGGTPTDYDPRLQSTGTTASSSLTVSVYYQNITRFQTNNEISAKTTANKANFEAFMRNTYGYDIISNSTGTDSVTLRLISCANYFESTDGPNSVVPPAGSTNLNFVLPVYAGGQWQTIDISIPVSSTTVSFISGAGLDPSRKHITQWVFWRLAGFSSTNFLYNIINTS